MGKKYTATIEADSYSNSVIMLPDEMLNELGWAEEDELTITAGSATGAITIVNVTHNKRKQGEKKI
jgi:hypothetical protein